jgi:hypothetical protein
MPVATRQRVAEQHAEWLNLLRPDGPFISVPILTEALGQGLNTVPDHIWNRLRRSWTEVRNRPDLLLPHWNGLIQEWLRLPSERLVPGATVPELRGKANPDRVAYGPSQNGRAIRMLLYRHPWEESLTKGRAGHASPIENAAAQCRDAGVPLALASNGQHFALIHSRPQEATSTAIFDADLWLEERSLARAFGTLLDANRSLAPARRPDGTWSDGLAALFARSLEAHTEITDTLGRQVKEAVELLVAEFSRLDREAGGTVLSSVPDRQVYRGALTVLMRLVFLLYAEEKSLLPDHALYADSYGVAALYDALNADRNLHGDEVGDRRSAAWFRLLALFRAVHEGSEHPDLRIPAYGGPLFDPSAHQWLERAAVTDRVVHGMLDALLTLRRGRGGAAERLSYRSLSIEQIGHIYEGLLEYSCVKVAEPHLGLIGKREPEIPLSTVMAERAKGADHFTEWCKDTGGITHRQAEKALAAVPDVDAVASLHAASDNDADLAACVRPFLGLLRTDLRGLPAVFPAGSVLFTRTDDRRRTGTHYTPRALAEEVVKHTLDPICHRPGPAEGAEEPDWKVRPAAELLELRVCDPTMGAGTFLVSAVRYLADRLVEAWARDGLPADIKARLGETFDRHDLWLAAKREAAARCVYGVDRDPMAVELAKLSLWLETLAKDRPFSFLDHALRHGDSLVGLVNEDQLRTFHLTPDRGRTLNARIESVLDTLIPLLDKAERLRRQIEERPADDISRVAHQDRLFRESRDLTVRLRLAADAVCAAALATAERSDDAYDELLAELGDEIKETLESGDFTTVRPKLDTWLKGPRNEPIRPLHWPIEFPEVMRHGGFDAIIGNPPFMGGQRLTGAHGPDLREWLVKRIADGKRGSADLCAYFYLRELELAPSGWIGMIATNTISQGDTREVGLAQARDRGWTICRAVKSLQWPGAASVEVSLVWGAADARAYQAILDGGKVVGIIVSIDPQSRVTGDPHRLAVNAGKSFQGSIVLGKGFVLTLDVARSLIAEDPHNKVVLFPYLTGEDLNSSYDLAATRWVINFQDWSEERARTFSKCFEIVERDVKPVRMANNRKVYRDYWWQYAERRPALQRALAGLDQVLAIARVSKVGMPTLVRAGQVFSEQIVLFAYESSGMLALLSSEPHYSWWTSVGRSTLETRLRYTPSDGFDAYPQPQSKQGLVYPGKKLDNLRREIMERRGQGITNVYNHLNSPYEDSADIAELRKAHVEVDEAVKESYALDEEREPQIREYEERATSAPLPMWRQIELEHDFYETPQGVRFTISPTARVDVLDKLLALNHYRHQQEVEQGLTARKVFSRKRPPGQQGAGEALFPLPES